MNDTVNPIRQAWRWVIRPILVGLGILVCIGGGYLYMLSIGIDHVMKNY